MSSAWFQTPVHDAAPPSRHGVREGPFPLFEMTMGRCDFLTRLARPPRLTKTRVRRRWYFGAQSHSV